LLDKLIELIQKEDKAQAVKLCLDALESHELGVPVLYENVLAPALNRIIVTHSNEDEMIWREHVMSSIVRSIIETCYPYVIREREQMGKQTEESVLVVCPRQEEHDIGARMIADFYTIWGYKTTFVGANTPEKTVLNAIGYMKPRYIALSVSNYYNMFAAKRLIQSVRSRSGFDVSIIVGGHAFLDNQSAALTIGADYLLQSFEDIGKLRNGEFGGDHT
jgi:methanogenic corrinoid protein MtbC1